MEDYIPVEPDWKDFVSSKESLLSQFKRLDVKDHVCCNIYLDSGTIEDYSSLCSYLSEELDVISSNYIWQCGKPSFVVVIPENKTYSYKIQGFGYYGDNVDDEWFLVYFLFCISKRLDHACISITDADGQFLLIEAAEALPSWLTPQTSINRIWVRKGYLNIIPLEEGGCLSEGELERDFALNLLRSTTTDYYIANEMIQRAIYNRIKLYPQLAHLNIHKCVLTIPKDIAILLLMNPQIIAEAVTAFCNTERSEKPYLSKLSRFCPQENSDNIKDWVELSVPMSRMLYAQLNFHSFYPPSKLKSAVHESSRDTLGHPSVVAKSIMKAIDLGCRVTCGLEVVYQRSKKEATSVTALTPSLNSAITPASSNTSSSRNGHSSNSSSNVTNVPNDDNEDAFLQKRLLHLKSLGVATDEDLLTRGSNGDSEGKDDWQGRHRVSHSWGTLTDLVKSETLFFPHLLPPPQQENPSGPSGSSVDDDLGPTEGSHRLFPPPPHPPLHRAPAHIRIDTIISEGKKKNILADPHLAPRILKFKERLLEEFERRSSQGKGEAGVGQGKKGGGAVCWCGEIEGLQDGEQWLSFTPEDFDEEMRRRCAREGEAETETDHISVGERGGATVDSTSSQTINSGSPRDEEGGTDRVTSAEASEVLPETADINVDMDQLVESMRRFMRGSSGVEGVEHLTQTQSQTQLRREETQKSAEGLARQPAGRASSRPVVADETAATGELKPLELNMDKLMSLLQGEGMGVGEGVSGTVNDSSDPLSAFLASPPSDSDDEDEDYDESHAGRPKGLSSSGSNGSDRNNRNDGAAVQPSSSTSHTGTGFHILPTDTEDKRKSNLSSTAPVKAIIESDHSCRRSVGFDIPEKDPGSNARPVAAETSGDTYDSDDEHEEGAGGGNALDWGFLDDRMSDEDADDDGSEGEWGESSGAVTGGVTDATTNMRGWSSYSHGVEEGEEDEEEGELQGEEFIRSYMAAMDAELNSSPILKQSFEHFKKREQPIGSQSSGEEDGDGVDLEVNFLKYMLEAHAAQMGGSGPVSNLLSQLGIELPKPPLSSGMR